MPYPTGQSSSPLTVESPSPSPSPHQAWPRRAALLGAHVLLVEDNPIIQELVQEVLRVAGVHVTTASNGREAIALLDEALHDGFDAVLMDCQMPVLDGHAATREIRMQAHWAALPIIAMTASAMPSDRRKALDAGMDDHIVKPIEANAMLDALARWVRPAGTAPADR